MVYKYIIPPTCTTLTFTETWGVSEALVKWSPPPQHLWHSPALSYLVQIRYTAVARFCINSTKQLTITPLNQDSNGWLGHRRHHLHHHLHLNLCHHANLLQVQRQFWGDPRDEAWSDHKCFIGSRPSPPLHCDQISGFDFRPLFVISFSPNFSKLCFDSMYNWSPVFIMNRRVYTNLSGKPHKWNNLSDSEVFHKKIKTSRISWNDIGALEQVEITAWNSAGQSPPAFLAFATPEDGQSKLETPIQICCLAFWNHFSFFFQCRVVPFRGWNVTPPIKVWRLPRLKKRCSSYLEIRFLGRLRQSRRDMAISLAST